MCREAKLKVITEKEHKEWCRKEIKEKGLTGAVQDQLDEWVSICHPLGYLGFSESVERAQNIMDMIKEYEKGEKRRCKK